MTSYLYVLLIITKLVYVIGHGHSHSHHTSHSSESSYSSYSSYSYKPYRINRIVPSSVVSYYVYTHFNNAIKNDFENYGIYRVFNVSSIITNNTNGIECIYYNYYPNPENTTLLLIANDSINFNISTNINYFSKFCVNDNYHNDNYHYDNYYSNDINQLFMNILLILIVIFYICCFCCDDICDTKISPSSNSSMV